MISVKPPAAHSTHLTGVIIPCVHGLAPCDISRRAHVFVPSLGGSASPRPMLIARVVARTAASKGLGIRNAAPSFRQHASRHLRMCRPSFRRPVALCLSTLFHDALPVAWRQRFRQYRCAAMHAVAAPYFKLIRTARRNFTAAAASRFNSSIPIAFMWFGYFPTIFAPRSVARRVLGVLVKLANRFVDFAAGAGFVGYTEIRHLLKFTFSFWSGSRRARNKLRGPFCILT